jgi:hypothetical protein
MIFDFEGGERKVESLEKIIKSNRAVDYLYQHSAFNPGQVPAALFPKKRCVFKGKDEKIKQVMKAVLQQPEFSLLWEVEVKGSKILPIGVGLVVQKQILISKGERYAP